MSSRFHNLFAVCLATAVLAGSASGQAPRQAATYGADPSGLAQPGIAQPAPVQAPRRQPLFRHLNIDAAWRASQQTGRPMLVYVTSKQCHFCDKMLKETWSHPQIAQAVAQRFEPVALLKEDNAKLVKELGVRAYPTTIVVSPKGELAGHIRGFANPQKFATALLMPPQDNRLSAQQASARQPQR